MNGKAKKPIFKKWWLWVIVVLFIGVIGSINSEEETAAVQPEVTPATAQPVKQKETEKTEPEAITVSAVDLFTAYDENEIAADQKYKGKTVEVSGTIKDIGKDILDKMYITFETGDMIRSVQVFFDKNQESEVASLTKGKQITIVGKNEGLMMNVLIKNATIK